MKTNPITIADLEDLAGILAMNHEEQMKYFREERMPPKRLITIGRKLRAEITSAMLPLLNTLCVAGDLTVAVFPADGSKYSLSYDAESVCANGGIQINCTQSADDAQFERAQHAKASVN